MTTGKYATNTTVAVDASRAEIERTLRKYNCTSFATGWTDTAAAIQFDISGRRVKFELPLPSRSEFTTYFDTRYNREKERSPKAAEQLWEQACRSAWRSLLLVIKANLEAVEAGIMKFEVVFLPYLVLPSGATVAEEVGAQVADVYARGLTGPNILSLNA